MKNSLKISLGVLLSAYLAYHTYGILFDTGTSFEALQFDVVAVLLAVSAVVLAYHFRVVRWNSSIALISPGASLRGLYGPLYAGFSINGLVPLRAGDVLRIILVQRDIGLPYSKGLATLLIERIYDVVAILLILSTCLYALESMPMLGLNSRHIAAGSLLIAAAVLSVIFFSGVFCRLIHHLERLFEWPALVSRMLGFIEATLESIGQFHRRAMYLRMLMLSLLIWLVEGAVVMFFLVPFAGLAPWVAASLGNLGTLIPSTPGHIGTFDYFMSEGLQSFGYTELDAATATLLTHLCIWLPVTTAGLVYLLLVRGESIPRVSLEGDDKT